jgi:antitoxin component YwqK of YwqJK toxin-antitoxin module
MIKILLTLLFLISGISIYSQNTDTALQETTQQPVEIQDVVFINQLCYTKKDTVTPFTGSVVVHKGKDGPLLSKDTYKNGLRNGQYIEYWMNNGNIKSIKNFVNCIEQGNYLEYSENGKIATAGHYKDGVETGIWFFFDKAGNITDRKDYYRSPGWHKRMLALVHWDITIYSQITDSSLFENNGKPVEIKDVVFINQLCYAKKDTATPFTGSIAVYKGKDGQVLSRNTYKNGLRNGPYVEYWANSNKIKSIKYFVNCIEQGKYVAYSERGKIATLGQYKDGIESGTWFFLDDVGNVTGKKEYHEPPGWHKQMLAIVQKHKVGQ